MMDGFAVRSSDFSVGGSEMVELDVAVDLAAGDVTALEIARGACGRIMTGAPIPKGADAVVPVECAVDGTSGVHAGGRVRLRDDRFRAGQHIARRGAAFHAGQEVLAVGMTLGRPGPRMQPPCRGFAWRFSPQAASLCRPTWCRTSGKSATPTDR